MQYYSVRYVCFSTIFRFPHLVVFFHLLAKNLCTVWVILFFHIFYTLTCFSIFKRSSTQYVTVCDIVTFPHFPHLDVFRFIFKQYISHHELYCGIQWNSVNKSTSGQPVLDLIRGGFNKRRFLKCTRRFRSKQIGCNKRLDLLTVDLLTEFHCIFAFPQFPHLVFFSFSSNKSLH